MRTVILAVILVIGMAFVVSAAQDQKMQTPKWSFNGTVIEACSCPMFCQCFFVGEPAAHHHNGHEEHFCLGNLAYKVNKGNDGLMLMPNTVEAYRVGPKAFEFKNTNGFVVTIDANSEDYKGM